MIDLTEYSTNEGEPFALVADLAARLAEAEAAPVQTGTGYAMFRDGSTVNWTSQLSRPTRRRGRVTLADPESFADYLARNATEDSLLYADLPSASITAVLNDHPAADPDIDAADVEAGYRDDLAVMQLREAEDWQTILRHNGQFLPQRTFAELIEELAHTVTTPDSATMLEVASTLNVKQNIDFGSRTRTQSGDVEFRYEQTSDARAGRDTRIEIPTVIAFTTNPWVGTAPVEITARLRFRASQDGCAMGYKLIRLADVTEAAFRDIVVEINGRDIVSRAVFGNAGVSSSRY